MKHVAILGSTGSIGTNSLNVIRHLKKDFKVSALAAKKNIDLLEQQAREFEPKIIAVYDEQSARELKKRLPNHHIVAGIEGIKEAAAYSENDIVISAMVGTLGLAPTIAAIQAKKTIALANKETLVSGGALITGLAKKFGVDLIPVDSEHSALFQCLKGERRKDVRRLILTASGGPFRNYSEEQLKSVSVQCALKHPSWSMGPKVTIDSSTLMNKGLEVIEAHWLFDIPIDQIDVVVHPQSIIHSMVEMIDYSILAQMGEPSMVIPIQYALTYPERAAGTLKPFDFLKNSTLQFFLPDVKKFRCLQLAYDAIRAGGSLPCYMNAANEVLVERYINREFPWIEISLKLERLMHRHTKQSLSSLEDVFAIDAMAREEAKSFI